MTVYFTEGRFLYPILTKITQGGKNPTYTSIKQLRDELIPNIVAVYSDLGDGKNIQLFIVVSENEYNIVILLLKPTVPTNPIEKISVSTRTGARTTPIICKNIKENFREYTIAKLKYSQYHNTSRCLIKQIIGALPMIYIQNKE